MNKEWQSLLFGKFEDISSLHLQPQWHIAVFSLVSLPCKLLTVLCYPSDATSVFCSTLRLAFSVVLVLACTGCTLLTSARTSEATSAIAVQGTISWCDGCQHQKIQLFAIRMASKEWHSQFETLNAQFNLSSLCARCHYFNFLSSLMDIFFSMFAHIKP